jgi:hypothetical protein
MINYLQTHEPADWIVTWMPFITLIFQLFIAILTLYIMYQIFQKTARLMVTIYSKTAKDMDERQKQEIKEQEKEREIIGKEKLLLAIVMNYCEHVSRQKFEPHMLWVKLEHLYQNKDNLRSLQEHCLGSWTGVETIHKLFDIDSEIRQYYGIKIPERPENI